MRYKITLAFILLAASCDRLPSLPAEKEPFVIKDSATLAQANATTFGPGDKIRVQGHVKGVLTIRQSGDSARPISIDGDTIGGLQLLNVGGIQVQRLVFIYDSASVSGVVIYSDDNKRHRDITVDGVNASGYPYSGIDMSLLWVQENNYLGGYENVTIKNCRADSNGYAGINSMGSWPGMQNKNVNIINCQAGGNKGIKDMRPHSGHGIVLSGVVGGSIKGCTTDGNGWKHGHGNIGAWTFDAKGVTIESCTSRFNKSTPDSRGNYTDGGGFDIDGGASNCFIINCFSQENYGAGYLSYEYGSPNPMENNSFIGNISINDGQRGNYSAFSLGGNVPVPGLINIWDNTATLLPGKPFITYYAYKPTNINLKNNTIK